MSETEKPRTFEEIWKDTQQWGDDLKSYARLFFEEATKQNMSEELKESIVEMCSRTDKLFDYYEGILASKADDVAPLAKKLASHKHLPDGTAVEPL